ncbi:MAG TPA: ATP-dependent DNA helicase RecG [Longimicrobiales bacterium]|nr:ATP-dependent DNA helicase RecG [Longimicrobiales bacterium]
MPRPLVGSLLDQPAQFLKGVGPRRAEQFARLGIATARDLLYHVPRRYEDASTVTRIGDARIGTDVTIIGEVKDKGIIPTRRGLKIFQALLRDESGTIECSWPGQPFLDRTIKKGDLILATGPVRYFQRRQLQPREFVILGEASEGDGVQGKVLPIYPATEGLSQRVFRNILEQNLDALLEAAISEEVFDPQDLSEAGLPTLRAALESLHRPTSLVETHHGRRRLAYEELFFVQLLHALAHHHATAERAGRALQRTDQLVGALYRGLPFRLTDAQTRALREIFHDLTAPTRMNRLLQGDVGSGKTVVALFAMLLAAENNLQSALMAPTEILAEQHARTLTALLGNLPVHCVLLTGSLSAAERRAALTAIADGSAQIVVGTHALIQEGVSFQRLGLAIVDEQHRFGVRQRLALAESGDRPDVLVMSATPIPRSLALTVYGDLDLSVLDQMPPGRKPIRTIQGDASARNRIYDFIREQVKSGRQAYIVYPLVAESEKVDLRAATVEYERLSGQVFPELRLGLLHGQLPSDEKDRTMRAFVAGGIDIMVATTVIEVGIDVPNATVMVIEHAERFGLSQLHQLRGRVGRGAAESHCILISEGGEDATLRLRIFVETEDGFEIARADLRLRGMGDFFGARQHGLPVFRFFDPEQDDDLLARARARARAIVQEDPTIAHPEHQQFRTVLISRYGERSRLYRVG